MTRRWRLGERGSTAVEFALLMPVFLAFILGVIEFGRAMWTRSVMQFAVEQAARYALVRDTATAAAIEEEMRANLIGLSQDSVVVVVSTAGSAVSITATNTFEFLVPQLLPYGPLELTAGSRLPR
ncbi:MAG: pilus assembly protein [Magnetospirillum sp.]|nr:pilus assembly protein [Magnetospirillum sp.]